METESIGKLLAGMLAGGGITAVASALGEGLKLANHLIEPDPVKRAKARREYILNLGKIVNSIEGADVKTVTTLLIALRELLDSY